MTRRNLVLLLFLSAGLTGCGWSFYQAVQPYHKAMYSWLGAPVEEVQKSWGRPESVIDQPSGRRLYTWIRTEQVPDPELKGSPQVQITCRTVLVVDQDGRIVNFNPDDDTSRACAKLPPPPARSGS